MLVGEPASGASHAALDFIGDQQSIVLARQPVSGFRKLFAHRTYATLALKELKTDGANGVIEVAFQVGNIVEFHELHAGQYRDKGGAVFFFMGGGQRPEGASVKRMFQSEIAPLRLLAIGAI